MWDRARRFGPRSGPNVEASSQGSGIRFRRLKPANQQIGRALQAFDSVPPQNECGLRTHGAPPRLDVPILPTFPVFLLPTAADSWGSRGVQHVWPGAEGASPRALIHKRRF